jgi:hypothetical protein
MKNRRQWPVRVMQGLLVIAVVADVPLVALEIATHVLVNQRAVESWTYEEDGVARNRLDQVLTEALGYREGRGTRLGDRVVQQWIDLGGDLEDQGWPILFNTGRFYNHFHDPLQPWNAAGLTFLGPNESSVRWMQNRDQGSTGAAGGNWSWHDARRMYYQALTEPDPAQREALLAATFRALGQIMHLVVDASVPEHVRNDEHPLGTTPFFWSYDTWIHSRHGSQDESNLFVQRFLSNPIGPDPGVFQIPIPGSEPANVPIARLIDTDAYNGSNPGVTFNATSPSAPVAIGLAEIANANFFSEDTLRGSYPPFPRPGTDGLIRTELLTPRRTPDGRDIVRRYWTRPEGQGLLPANPLRAECAGDLNPRGGPSRPYPCVDDVVWNQVAAHMLPRAVGYARGVLEYFFRGSMRVHTLSTDEGGAFIRIENLTDEEMEGVFEIYSRPMADAPDESREQVGLVADGAVTTVSAKTTVTLPVSLLPGEHPTASQVLVFRGRLGLELDGVAAQIFDVHHLLITQTAATTAMSDSCGTLSRFNRMGSFCSWRGTSYDVQGDLLTDATVPVLARVSASWEFTGGSKSAQIELDDVPIPGGVWRRQGTEPDPQQFRILAGANQGNRLVVSVQLVSGDTVTMPMALLAFGSASTINSFTNPRSFRDPGPWHIAAERTATATSFVHPPFRTLSIAGHPNPANVRVNRFSDSRLEEYLTVSENPFSNGALYRQRWIDDAEVFTIAPPGGPIVLREVLTERLLTMPVGPPPVVLMEAQMERVYEPAELAFLKTFVTSEQPTQTFTIVGRRPGD